jgi:hypothetical protein
VGEEKRMIVNNIETQCICVWRQYNVINWKLKNHGEQRDKERVSNRAGQSD